ncbi:MAG: enoyl-CoA hydratase/isomerase family protein [Myxococcota bacterium]|jgi:enoyl-CoA hydratase/carnithine racemase|nr:enoyl-CoA hydratase/isomerase family protein [Myxococcota bacterium]
MTHDTLNYEEKEGVAYITLDRPEGNRINVQMVSDLTKVCDRLEDDSEASHVVLQGANGAFSMGVDFADFQPGKDMDIHGFNKWEKICRRLEKLPKTTVALVDGPAFGGGFQLVLTCDLRLATERARFQMPEVHMGFLPGMATFRLAKYIGLGRAKRLMLTAEEFGAQAAHDMGIIDRIDTPERALAWADEALGPKHSVAVELARRLLNESFADSWEDAVGHFLAAQHRSISQTAFLETLQKQKS